MLFMGSKNPNSYKYYITFWIFEQYAFLTNFPVVNCA